MYALDFMVGAQGEEEVRSRLCVCVYGWMYAVFSKPLLSPGPWKEAEQIQRQSSSSVRGILQARILELGCHVLFQEIFLTQGSKPFLSPALAGGLFTTSSFEKHQI